MILKKVTEDNLEAITSLAVREDQKSFVATNTQSLLEAYIALSSRQTALPFGLYEGEDPVGFVMFGYGGTGEEGEPKVAAGNYCIWRFMIDAAYQRRGYGRAALSACLEYLRKTPPLGSASLCWLSYEPENTVARALYASAGFRENGELCGGEIVATLPL